MSVVLGEGQEVRGVLCVQRAGERVGARMWRGHARASRPFRITGRDEMVMAARVVVEGGGGEAEGEGDSGNANGEGGDA